MAVFTVFFCCTSSNCFNFFAEYGTARLEMIAQSGACAANRCPISTQAAPLTDDHCPLEVGVRCMSCMSTVADALKYISNAGGVWLAA